MSFNVNQKNNLRTLGLAVLALGIASSRLPAAENISAAVSSVTRVDLSRHINFLASDALEGREAGTRGAHAAAAYITDRLKAFNAQPLGDDGSFIQEFGNGYRNVIATIPGSDPSLKNECILIGAHLDHVGYGSRINSFGPIGRIHNGADDNASGISGVLEVAEGLSRLSSPLPRTVVIAFWDGEEKGLLGSQHWVENPTVPLDRIKFAINLDMIGRLADDTVTVYGSRSTIGLRQKLAGCNEATNLKFNYDYSNRDDSDHFTFYKKRIPYLMIFTGEHADYHRPTDDADRINFDGAERISRLVLRVLVAQAETPRLAGFYEGCRDQTSPQKVKYRPAPPRLGITWSSKPQSDGSLIVMAVDEGTPAYLAGVRTGDMIISVAGRPVAEINDLRSMVFNTVRSISMSFRKAGSDTVESLTFTLGGMPIPSGCVTAIDETDPDCLVIATIASSSVAESKGFRAGDRLLSVNTDSGDSAALTLDSLSWVVEREGRTLTLPDQKK